mgnify:CR=1 FL=1
MFGASEIIILIGTFVNNVINKILFKDGKACGVDKNIIHSLNKNEVSLPDDIHDKIKNRNNVILLGDQVSDLNMINKNSNKNVLSIGFVTDDNKIDELLANYDIVFEKE